MVPPHVMEKWFDLADNIPNNEPLAAGDTGKSLATIYGDILHETKIKGFDQKTQELQARYRQSVAFLNEFIRDPENPEKDISRLALYERYQELYNNRTLDMNNQVEDKRKNFGSLDFELWFQRNYPSLEANAQSAYTRWMVFGMKERVEAEVAYLDAGSSGSSLERARISLRSSAVSSLDRTRTIYPVSFEPSDWYKYLLPEVQRPSRDQLQQMLGRVLSKQNAVNAMIEAANSQKNLADISSLNDARSHANETVRDTMDQRYRCLVNGDGQNQICQDFRTKQAEAILAIHEEADSFTNYQTIVYNVKSKSNYIAALRKQISVFEEQERQIHALLDVSIPFLGQILDNSNLYVANLTEAYRDDQWLRFSFNSEQYHLEQDTEKTSLSTSSSWKVGGFFFGASHSSSYHKDTAHFHKEFSQSHLSAKGELLRVTIKRPWFRPDLFQDPDFDFRQVDDNGNSLFVSPGPLPERQFYSQVSGATGGSRVQYKLPEYVTSFVLARNIELAFAGLDYETVSDAMNEMSQSSTSVNIFCFHASHSKSQSKSTSNLSVSRSADGMVIKIPGAQIIGYFTEVVPRFPL